MGSVDSATAAVPDFCLYPLSQNMEQLAISVSGRDDKTPVSLLTWAVLGFTQDEPTSSIDCGLGVPDPLPDAGLLLYHSHPDAVVEQFAAHVETAASAGSPARGR